MFERTVLDNGLRIVTSSMPHTKAVSVLLLVGAGSRYERVEEMGISHFLEHMLFKGTTRRPLPQQISEAIEGVGGVLNASTDREMTVYWCKTPQQHFPAAADLLVDMVRESLFRSDDLEKERDVVVEELAMTNDFPTDRVGVILDELIWPDQPMGRDVGGTKESVEGITRDMMLDYLGRQYVPANVVASVAGGVAHDEVVELVNGRLGSWRGAAHSPWFPVENGQKEPRVALEHRQLEQAHLSLGLEAYSAHHPDRYALDLLSIILGEGMSSRLFVALREEQGLSYDIASGVQHLLDTGAFIVSAGVDPSKLEQAMGSIMEELAKAKRGASPEELAKAKEVAKGRMLLGLEDSRRVASFLGSQELLLDRILTADEVLERVDAVAVDDIHRVANDVLVESALNLAVVGPVENEDALRELLRLP